MSEMRELLELAAEKGVRYAEGVVARRVAPSAEAVAGLARFREKLPEESSDARSMIEMLDEVGSPATAASTGGRYFGFVIGGSLPAVMAANWLAGAWDQNACLRVMSPVAAELEDVALGWICDALGLPADCDGGFVTCATAANFSGLAAARSMLLAREGWNVEEDGLFGAPPIEVIVGEEYHASMQKALSMVGLGKNRVTRVPTDSQGRMRADKLPKISPRSIVCIQSGNVNTGAFDPAEEICKRVKDVGAWVHVDGAFGLWARVSPKYGELTRGLELADSWALDAHKWLNVSYDSGVVIVRNGLALKRSMAMSAAYLQAGALREAANHVPESSRRARGVEIWAAMKSLGRSGVRELVERTCELAQLFAERLRAAGYEILNDVVINQALVSFGSAERTREVIQRVQEEGTCWCGGTVWQGKTAMRISVSSWATTVADIGKSADAIVRIAKGV
ncbi:MAG TPA: aminotransferase class V-fold PLP-dependent enzyme [Candidatus Sulfotelmatobacter sp.]|jgi:glutamate/tyrosine decarboxylase-like PLP-dependent enzyme|nr:aminotransferase class V-fold PLP-dependent enzyme [Candidatus Sulfotelmatobacter sp.]